MPSHLGHELGTPTIVGQEQDQGVIKLTQPFERIHQRANGLVHPIYHSGIGSHLTGLPIFVLFICPAVDAFVTGRDVPSALEDPLPIHFFVSRSTNMIPALVIHAIIFGDVFGMRMKWPMRCRVGEIEEERLFIFNRAFDHPDCLVRDRVREVEIIGDCFNATVIFEHVVGREEMRGSIHDPIEMIKAALTGGGMLYISNAPTVIVAGLEITSHMPFARHERPSPLTQMFGNGGTVVAQKPLIGGRAQIRPHMSNARIVRIKPRQERGPRRTTAGAIIHGGQQNAALCERVNVGCSDF